MIEAIVWGAGVGVLSVILVGVRRIPGRYAGLVGLGTGAVFAALRLVMSDASFEPAFAVIVGAIGGSVATVGSERGERERVRRSDAILSGRPSMLE